MTREEREDAITFFKNKLENEVYHTKYNTLAIEALGQEPRWIPVSERLPKDGGTFIISYEEIMASGYVFKGVESMELVHGDGMEWIDDLGHRFESNYRKVKAWMPLPKPYEPQKNEEEQNANND